MAMSPNRLKKIVKYLLDVPSEKMRSDWGRFLGLLRIRHPDLTSEIVSALERPGEFLGLTEDELIELALRLDLPRISKVVSKKISPAKRERFFEAFGAVPGTSFTSTANVATYPVPIGMVRRRQKKRK